MKEHNYAAALQNADTRPRLQRRTQNIWQAGICISPVLRSRRANIHLLVKFNVWTTQRLGS